MSVGAMPRGISAESKETAYRPVSKAAAIELGVSIASSLAFATAVAWVVPVANLIMSIRTSLWLERAKHEYAGQLLAKLAIFISLICAVGAPTKHFVERYLIVEEAVTACNQFLDLVLANQVKEAFVLTLAPVNKIGMENKLDALIERAGQTYRDYLNWDAVIKLRGRLQQAQVTYCGLASRSDKPGQDLPMMDRIQDWIDGSNFMYAQGAYQVALRYRISLDDGAVFEVVTLLVGGTGDWKGRQWFVSQPNIKAVL